MDQFVVVLSAIGAVFTGTGIVTLMAALPQINVSKRAHLLNVYTKTFEIADTDVVRKGRHLVYSLKDFRAGMDSRDWDSTTHPYFDRYKEFENDIKPLCRAFDKLGLLVREGVVPINIIARFYASPVLRTWYLLTPAIHNERKKEERKQPGHFWEWENLVFSTIVPGLKDGTGIWTGVSEHDGLKQFAEQSVLEREWLYKDSKYAPASQSWIVKKYGPLSSF